LTPEIIFDFDGTLADTAILTMAALKNIAPGLGITIPPLETVRAAIGYRNPEFYYHVFPGEPEDIIIKISDVTENEEQRLLPDLGEDLLFPGVRELLDELMKRRVTMHIASTGSYTHVNSVLKKTGIGGMFNKILCDRPGKAGMVAEIIGDADKNNFIMVGDMAKDLEAARANKIIAVGALYGYCKFGSGFDFYIDSPAKLLSYLPA